MAHTKAPWKRMRQHPDEIWSGSFLIADQVAEENRPMIEAAPEMYEALKRILYAHDNHGNGAAMGEAILCQQYASMAREALAKAEGREV